MKMTKIDALLMDHALGGTSEEVAALVEAYVERDADAQRRLEELRRTVGLAKRALASEPVALPAFPREALERSVDRKIWLRRVMIGGAMAACVAVGVLMGNFRGEQKGEPVVAKTGEAEPSQKPVEMATVKDFWSTARLRASAEQASKETNAENDLRDRIPFRRPFGGG